jgi:hypothetical protein
MTLGVSELLAQVAFDLTGTGVSWGHGPPRMSHFFGIYLFPKARVNLEPKIGRSTIWSHSNTRMRICKTCFDN